MDFAALARVYVSKVMEIPDQCSLSNIIVTESGNRVKPYGLDGWTRLATIHPAHLDPTICHQGPPY